MRIFSYLQGMDAGGVLFCDHVDKTVIIAGTNYKINLVCIDDEDRYPLQRPEVTEITSLDPFQVIRPDALLIRSAPFPDIAQ